MEVAVDRIQHLHDGLCAADEVLCKALRVDEFAQAAKAEVRLREFLGAEWDKLSRQAAKSAAHYIRNGKGDVVTDTDLDKAQAIIDRTMAQWSGKVTDRFVKGINDIYRLSHVAAAKKAFGLSEAPLAFSVKKTAEVFKAQPEVVASFNVVDRRALKALKRDQTFWIGQHYNQNVSRHIAETTRKEVLELGRSRAAAGRVLQKSIAENLKEVRVPDGFVGSSERYFEGLAANAATTARAQSSLNTFHRAGFTTYVIVNPGDHRTCVTCQHLDGKEFKVSDGLDLMAKLQGATPAGVKRLQPFITPGQARSLTGGVSGAKSPTAGVGKLAANGNLFPPFHFKCRCSVDIVATEEPLPIPEGVRTISVPKTPVAPRPASLAKLREAHWATKGKTPPELAIVE